MTKFNEAQLRYLEHLIVFKSDDPTEGFDVWGDVRGDVFGDVESVLGNVRSNVWCNVMGSVFGDVEGDVLIEELIAENKNLRHMIIDQIEGAGDDPEIMAASRAEWAARAKAAEAKLTLQPIETAPKDGTHIIVVPYGDVTDLQVSWFIGDEGRWANWDWSVEPTDWMPMPFAPELTGGEK